LAARLTKTRFLKKVQSKSHSDQAEGRIERTRFFTAKRFMDFGARPQKALFFSFLHQKQRLWAKRM